MSVLKRYKTGNINVMYKVIKGRPHPTFGGSSSRIREIGIAFRTEDSPIGYFPFYDKGDFNFSGDISIKEKILGNLPINLSAVASPYTILLKATAKDVDFMGSGSVDLDDIQMQVRKDLTSHAMASAGGVFVDGIMMAIGGPSIKMLVSQFTKSSVKQFLISTAISGAVKKSIKKQSNFDIR